MRLIKLDQDGMIDLMLIGVVFVAASFIGGYIYYQQREEAKTYAQAGKGVIVARHAVTKKPAQGAATDTTTP